MLQVEISGYLVFALLLYLLPFRWLMGFVLAAGVHELFHIVTLCSFRVRIHRITLGGFGVVMETDAMGPAEEALCALAGPLGSFFVVLFGKYMPEASVIALFQGLYNLLPIYPLDGGRVVRSIFSAPVYDAAETFTWILLLTAGIWLWSYGLGISGFFIPLWTLLVMIRRKIPCKQGNLAVQ